MSWQSQTAMMSPRDERAFWLKCITRRHAAGYGLAVNCRHMPSLSRTPQLQALIDAGLIVRTRQNRGGRCNRTVLILAEPT